jgi:polysaccharide pyruvyl transferase WcaK-like protein
MLEMLSIRHTNCRLLVVPARYLPRDERRMSAFTAALGRSFDLVDMPIREQRPPFWRWLVRKGFPALARALYFRLMQFRALRIVPHVSGAKAIYCENGDQWNGFVGLDMLATVTALKPFVKPIRTFPFSINPATPAFLTPALLRRGLGGLDLPLTARDVISLEVLRSLDIEARLVPDCVHWLAPMAAGVAPMAGRDPERILIAATGTPSKLKTTLEAAVRRFEGRPICLVTTCEREDGAIYAEIAARHGIEWMAPMTWQDLVAEFKVARVVVTNRLHGLILAGLAGAPVLPVCDRKKAEAYAIETGVPHAARDLDAVEPELVEAVARDREAVLACTARYRDTCRAALEAWLL